jgi:nitrogen regulatory protein PII
MRQLSKNEQAEVISTSELAHGFTFQNVFGRGREKHPVTGEERDEEELKKLANDFLALALGLDVQEITDFAAIGKSEAEKLKKVRRAGTQHDGSVFLVE